MPANRASQLTQVLKSGKPVVADLFMGAVAGNLRVGVGVPVIHDGKVAYSINASITPERLQGLLQQRLPADWVAAIIDNTGTIVARSRDQERFIGVKVSPAGVKRLSEQRESAVEVKSLEGLPALSAFSRSDVSGWAVALIIPSDELTAGLRRSMLWLGIATLLLLGVHVRAGLDPGEQHHPYHPGPGRTGAGAGQRRTPVGALARALVP